MAAEFELNAETRADLGKGASRRLRLQADLVPAIIYGAGKDPQSLSIPHKDLVKATDNEAFFSHILTINVGGEKVYPAEVESVVLQLDGVEDAAVYSLKHPITGMTVAAEIKITTSESLSEFKVRLRKHCANLMPAFKVPSKITLIDQYTHNARFKRMRKREAS